MLSEKSLSLITQDTMSEVELDMSCVLLGDDRIEQAGEGDLTSYGSVVYPT